ncbi:MAG TPA: S-methyl-5-thioribose-1-phosphate isomerase [Deltaproteobacteria bacterium]|nr:S-methyl-5-thioribose-1-phosphate isomerase [Deltaproteobacteria bacterium]
MIKPFYYKDGTFHILDQRLLPNEETWIACKTADQVAEAIKTLAVRGAPAIGIAAAYGLALAAPLGKKAVEEASAFLVRARPTAVNLEWAVRRMLAVSDNSGDLFASLLEEAQKIWKEEIQANEAMADAGADLFKTGARYRILTHCNAGSLATGGIGTAVGVIRRLHEQGKLERVYMDETRPLLQGARITAHEMVSDNIPATLITDSMAGWLMKLSKIDAVIVGADRIARNLDVANKIGTYSLAVLSHAHKIPFYIVAPESTFDPNTQSGEEIVIEQRDEKEVTCFHGVVCAPDVDVFNPSFDVTPHHLITAIITQEKVYTPG